MEETKGTDHVLWPTADEGPVGERRYEFEEVFAVGGLGVVRRAYDRRLGRIVAVKELQNADTESVRRFVREAVITARLQHPAIVPLYDIGRHEDGEPYYCMKMIDGKSLDQVIAEREKFSERLALVEHVRAAADAIAYAHLNRVIHRDLKPANILVGDLGETVVIDWGLAKDLSITSEDDEMSESLTAICSDELTEMGTVMGTLRYMPPEQAQGVSVDERSDVFALGAVLFHVLAGR
ncbi:MAG: serine/threonine-protein kinase, partial [Nannocystaceae bacterium]